MDYGHYANKVEHVGMLLLQRLCNTTVHSYLVLRSSFFSSNLRKKRVPQMARQVGAALAKFFMLDPRLGPTEETEHEKILYYYPDDTPLSQQQSDVGLSEALINFTKYVRSPSPPPLD
jgi:hypothetical protein